MIKIYRIIDNTNGNIYIGKTTRTLRQRLAGHKYDFKIGKSCSSQEILKNGDYKIELIEETEDESRERYYIENTQCVNKNIPGRTHEERYKEQREYRLENQKKYNENNKDKIKKYKKEYQLNHKDDKKNYDIKYREDNKLKIKNYQYMVRNYRKLWGDSNNNLLKIDPNLFLVH